MEVGGPCNGRGGLMNRSIYTLEEEPPEPREPATARLAALYRSARAQFEQRVRLVEQSVGRRFLTCDGQKKTRFWSGR